MEFSTEFSPPFLFFSQIFASGSQQEHTVMQKRGLLCIVALKAKQFTRYFIFVGLLKVIFSFQFLMSHCIPFLQTVQ